MAGEEQYLSYEQVLQELQIDRAQLNRLIREGLLKEHQVEGETKFRLAEAQTLKATLEKRPTVVQEGEAGKGAKTEYLTGEAAKAARAEADILEGAPPAAAVERDTEILEEEIELEEPSGEPPAVPEAAMETDLELESAKVEEKAEGEDFFDFSAQLAEEELELEEQAVEEAEEEEIVTDVLDLEAEEEVPEEDLLSEIMEIGEEEEEPAGAVESEDLTADITTMEEPTYEETALDEVLQGEEEAAFGVPGAEFEVPYAAPVAVAEGQVAAGWAVLLVLTLVVMLVGALFVVENSFNPEFATPIARMLAGS